MTNDFNSLLRIAREHFADANLTDNADDALEMTLIELDDQFADDDDALAILHSRDFINCII